MKHQAIHADRLMFVYSITYEILVDGIWWPREIETRVKEDAIDSASTLLDLESSSNVEPPLRNVRFTVR
jgi:hypothetical protein